MELPPHLTLSYVLFLLLHAGEGSGRADQSTEEYCSRSSRQQQFLGLQIGSGVWAEGVPDIALTSANVQRPCPSNILHCFEFKQDRNVWLLANHPSEPPQSQIRYALISFKQDAFAAQRFALCTIFKQDALVPQILLIVNSKF